MKKAGEVSNGRSFSVEKYEVVVEGSVETVVNRLFRPIVDDEIYPTLIHTTLPFNLAEHFLFRLGQSNDLHPSHERSTVRGFREAE